MLGRFPFEILPKYPHLSENESRIWTRFIEQNPNFAESVDYDICVGGETELPEELDEEWERNARYLGAYKIDAVAYRGGKHFVIEIRTRAGPSALGNIITYMALYQVKVGGEADAEPVIVTDAERPNIRELCAEHDIDFYVV